MFLLLISPSGLNKTRQKTTKKSPNRALKTSATSRTGLAQIVPDTDDTDIESVRDRILSQTVLSVSSGEVRTVRGYVLGDS